MAHRGVDGRAIRRPLQGDHAHAPVRATACGFQAHYGVANRTLPCGTKVRFRNGSHEVTATVDDRGPFVSGRTWDLGLNTRDALGFVGVGSIWASM